jgi:hypothetical protein
MMIGTPKYHLSRGTANMAFSIMTFLFPPKAMIIQTMPIRVQAIREHLLEAIIKR